MGKFSGVLLASDFDDTLCDGATNSIPRRSQRALEHFMEEGGRFVVATGRAHRTFAPWAPRVPMNSPAVLSNGSAVYDFERSEMLMQTYLRPRVTEDCEELARVFPELGFEAYHGEDIYVYNPNFVTEAHMKKVGAAYTGCAIAEMPTPWTKIIFQQDHAYLERVQDYVLSRWSDCYECFFSSPYLLEFTDKGSNKGTAVLWVADRLGIDRAHIYCVGDSPNDAPMLRASAIPFLVRNCAPGMTDLVPGSRVLSTCADGAVADIVDILETIY